MKKLAVLASLLVVFSVFVIAMPDFTSVSVEPSNGHAVVTIPENAVEVSQGVFSLGNAISNGEVVEGYAIVDYKKGFEHRPNHGKGGSGASSCFTYLASGAKWKNVEPWVVNTANTRGLGDSFVFGNLGGNIQKWEGSAGKDVVGAGSTTTQTLAADTESPDDANEVYFADIADSGAIGVTIVWGVFRGPPSTRKLVEWDQVYDDTDYDWSSIGEAGKMDFESIATHELGHTFGLGDLYEISCLDETMYGYADFGETKKRTLNAGDIQGVSSLYS